MRERIWLTEEERARRLIEIEGIERDIYRYPSITCFKYDTDVREYLMNGQIDFIAVASDWHGSAGSEVGIVRRAAPWGDADLGFEVRARTIDDLISTVNSIVEKYRDTANEIYFRCHSPEIPLPRVSVVDVEISAFMEYKQNVINGFIWRDEVDV